jgi:hypothetical protein
LTRSPVRQLCRQHCRKGTEIRSQSAATWRQELEDATEKSTWDFIEVVKQQAEIVLLSGVLTEGGQMLKDLNNNCIGTCKVLLDRLQELKASAGTKYRKWKYLHEGLKSASPV